VLTHLGDTHHATGSPQAARQAWQQALSILDDLNHADADNLRTRIKALGTPAPARGEKVSVDPPI